MKRDYKSSASQTCRDYSTFISVDFFLTHLSSCRYSLVCISMKRELPCAMAMPAASHRSSTLQALTVFSVLAVLVADVGARRRGCHPFSCGAFSNISYPFRRQDDSRHCGPYELVCTPTNATIRIGGGTYYVISIEYGTSTTIGETWVNSITGTPLWVDSNTGSSAWVVDTNLSMQSSCLLPRWDSNAYVPLSLKTEGEWATFVNCSQEINDVRYSPVRCLSTIDSFIYVLTTEQYYAYAQNFKPSCGYLARTPLDYMTRCSANYEDVVKSMRKGFPLPLPLPDHGFRECLAESMRIFREEPRNITDIKQLILGILSVELNFEFWSCMTLISTNVVTSTPITIFSITMLMLKSIHELSRFLLAPLAIFAYLARKYWKTKITIDAVEKFLRMQQLLGGPLRYAYTDIIAITGHFREKLGQGGYGSVYKGILSPGNVHVAIKMLSNSKCNGEEFISEVSTIGRIHMSMWCV